MSLSVKIARESLGRGLRLAQGVVDRKGTMPILSSVLLCVALESGRSSVPQTPQQWRRCLNGIMLGNDWEHGTWK